MHQSLAIADIGERELCKESRVSAGDSTLHRAWFSPLPFADQSCGLDNLLSDFLWHASCHNLVVSGRRFSADHPGARGQLVPVRAGGVSARRVSIHRYRNDRADVHVADFLFGNVAARAVSGFSASEPTDRRCRAGA